MCKRLDWENTETTYDAHLHQAERPSRAIRRGADRAEGIQRKRCAEEKQFLVLHNLAKHVSLYVTGWDWCAERSQPSQGFTWKKGSEVQSKTRFSLWAQYRDMERFVLREPRKGLSFGGTLKPRPKIDKATGPAVCMPAQDATRSTLLFPDVSEFRTKHVFYVAREK